MNDSFEPLVSIIIVNHSGKKFLVDCLESIRKSNYKNYEIILVDNNSSDDSKNFVRNNFPKIKIIELDKNLGFSIPNNMAAKIARGKYLVFLNNDTTVTPNWLNELVFFLEKNTDVSIGQSLLILPNGEIDSSGDYIDEIGRAFSSHTRPKNTQEIFSARGACMIISKKFFLEMGGFDESYFASFEDIEFGWRARLWGFKSVIIPNSIVYHIGGQTIKKIPDLISFHSVKNNIILRHTHFDFFDCIKSMSWMILILISNKLFGISIVKDSNKNLGFPSIKIILKSCLWVIKNYNLIYKKRKLVKSKQVITNKKLRETGLIKPIQKT